MRLSNFTHLSFVDNQDEVTGMYGITDPKVFTIVVLDESEALARFTWNDNKWSHFGLSPKSAICTESAVQIVTVTHTILTNFGARASPDSNQSRPVIGTWETGRAGV
jgi:hypothetical protein